MSMKRILPFVVVCIFWAGSAFAVPETVSVRVADVTPSSFSVVWMTDVAAEPAVEVYRDSTMTIPAIDSLSITPMPGASGEVASAARAKGIMKVRVSGLSNDTAYYVRTVTADPADASNVGYSSLVEVRTTSIVKPYTQGNDGTIKGFSNDLLSFRVYIRPSDTEAVPGLGDLLVLETDDSPYPISAFAGEGIAAPEGALDLNNLFGPDMASLDIQGSEKARLRIYRGGTLSTLLHYRKMPADGNSVNVAEPVEGFFADINIDGKVDDSDFTEFKRQYRTGADDSNYNQDYDFIEDENSKVDAKDFSRFAREYGRTDVE